MGESISDCCSPVLLTSAERLDPLGTLTSKRSGDFMLVVVGDRIGFRKGALRGPSWTAALRLKPILRVSGGGRSNWRLLFDAFGLSVKDSMEEALLLSAASIFICKLRRRCGLIVSVSRLARTFRITGLALPLFTGDEVDLEEIDVADDCSSLARGVVDGEGRDVGPKFEVAFWKPPSPDGRDALLRWL